MRIDSAGFSHIGPKKINQDAILMPQEIGGVWWAAIADGVGGSVRGEVASKTAIDAVQSAITEVPSLDMQKLFHLVHQRMKELSRRDPALARMATTLSVVRLSASQATVGHVGDTRVYHLRAGGIQSRTKDQTEAQHLIDEGVITRARAKVYHRRNVLLSALSPSSPFELEVGEFGIAARDRILLLTDGLYEHVSKLDIRDMSVQLDDIREFCNGLERLVVGRGVHDDFSAVCISITSLP